MSNNEDRKPILLENDKLPRKSVLSKLLTICGGLIIFGVSGDILSRSSIVGILPVLGVLLGAGLVAIGIRNLMPNNNKL